MTPDGSHEDQAAVKQGLISAYKSSLYDNVKAELHQINLEQYQEHGLEDKNFGEWPTNWLQQFSVLLRRGIKERKYQAFSGLKIGQVLVISILCGLLWWQSDASHIQDKVTYP